MQSIIKSNDFLRVGLAFVFLFAGIESLRQPHQWLGFVPAWVEQFGVSRETALMLHAVADIGLGVWLLSGLFAFWAGLAASGALVAIVVLSGPSQLLITFRDIGLALAALGYAASTRKNKQGGKEKVV
ncbi:MAG: DoxX family membrane protein [Candidatus Spechtbacterales bacterium]